MGRAERGDVVLHDDRHAGERARVATRPALLERRGLVTRRAASLQRIALSPSAPARTVGRARTRGPRPRAAIADRRHAALESPQRCLTALACARPRAVMTPAPRLRASQAAARGRSRRASPARSASSGRASGIGGPASARSGMPAALRRDRRVDRLPYRPSPEHVHVPEDRVQLRDELARARRRRCRGARARRCAGRRRA